MKTKPTNELLISITLICITSTYEIVTPLSFINSSISIESQASTEIEKKILTERASCINDFSSGNELNSGVFSSVFPVDFFRPGNQGANKSSTIANSMDINTYVLI